MGRIVIEPSARRRLLAGAAVIALHLAAILVLVRAFAPDAMSSLAVGAFRTVDVALPPAALPPSPEPASKRMRAVRPKSVGASGAPAPRASSRPLEAPSVPISLSATSAATTAGPGAQAQSGSAETGQGSGAQGSGQGAGAGTAGEGVGGGGGGSPPVKIAGEINSARDYPRASRDQRINSRVVIALTVGADGRVTACRILQPSPDPSAGPITCALATKRFRFRPATDAAGRPVEAQFGWQQRWFY